MENSIETLLQTAPGRVRLREVFFTSLAAVAEVGPDELDDDVELAAVGLDSLTMSEVFVRIEEELDDEIPDHILLRYAEDAAVVTLGDLLGVFGLGRGELVPTEHERS